MNDTPPNETDQDAFARLEQQAATVADSLHHESRPFDSYPSDPHQQRKPRGIFRTSRNGTKTPDAWRLHSLRLSETTIFSNDPGAAARYEQVDDELWLSAEGELQIISFRYETQGEATSFTSSTAALTPLSAARYDAKPVWKTRQSIRGTDHVEEAWLEMLGRPWYQKPFASISAMLTDLQAAGPVASGIFSTTNPGR